MRMTAGLAAVLVLTGLLPAGCSRNGGAADTAGDWAAFYTSSQDRSQYFYDRAGLQNGSDQLVARWKRVNPQGATSFYQIEIHCRARTFTERGTTIVEPDGRDHEVPKAELFVDHPIRADSSTDVFARRFCPAQAAGT